DQHLNRPSFQIVGYNSPHRSTQIISNDCDMFTFSFVGMFFFDVQQRGSWNSNATIVQAHFQNGVAGSVLSGGMMTQFANSLHLFGSFESLGVIDNEKQMFVLLGEQTPQHIQCNLLHYYRFIPDASPEKFAMISAMSTVTQQPNEPVNRTTITNTDRQQHRPEIAVYMFRNLFFDRLEKTFT
ncbi:MAG: hypothetical protein ABIG61_17410, partial [Planctomycetota bacterium]